MGSKVGAAKRGIGGAVEADCTGAHCDCKVEGAGVVADHKRATGKQMGKFCNGAGKCGGSGDCARNRGYGLSRHSGDNNWLVELFPQLNEVGCWPSPIGLFCAWMQGDKVGFGEIWMRIVEGAGGDLSSNVGDHGKASFDFVLMGLGKGIGKEVIEPFVVPLSADDTRGPCKGASG